jgi:hypothetical protein
VLEGGIFAQGSSAQCCAGLAAVSNCAGSSSVNCQVTSYVCQKNTCAAENQACGWTEATKCCDGYECKLPVAPVSTGLTNTYDSQVLKPGYCVKKAACIAEGKKGALGQLCCAGLTANYYPAVNDGGNNSAAFICQKCGDGICSEDETQEYCSKDCGCGNGRCETKENQLNCPKDCASAVCAKEYWPCWTSTESNSAYGNLSPRECCAGLTCQMGAISGTCMPAN